MFWKTLNKYGFTENNALTLKTTGSKVLDLFAMGGAYRGRSEESIIELFSDAFEENPVMATKCLFYIRDCREGMGEKRFFRVASKWLVDTYKDFPFDTFVDLAKEYGSWKDIFSTFDLDTYKEKIRKEFHKNFISKTPTLMEKYMPSIGGSKNREAEGLASYLNLTPKQYRQYLSKSRKTLNIVETKMSSKDWKSIDYQKVPSKAMLNYVQAFKRNDEDRYSNYLNEVKEGKAKINTKTLLPYEIVTSLWNSRLDNESATVIWNNLPDYTRGENAIVMADVSGSMMSNEGLPMAVSISLALYFAERNKGKFNGSFMTFSANPSIVNVNLKEKLETKINKIHNANWGANTDLIKAFGLILKAGIDDGIPQDEMPKTIYIISDMEFDEATGISGYHREIAKENLPSKTNFKAIEEMYNNAGYEIPNLVFWNVDSRHNNVPVGRNELGVALVSGASPTVFKMAVSDDVTPEGFLNNTLNTDRYKDVEKLFLL